MDIQFIASIAVIASDPEKSRELFVDALGLRLEASPGGDYFHSEQIDGSKHFGVWPLSEAAQACFGTPDWPADRVVPQMSLEFEVSDADTLFSRPPRNCANGDLACCTIGARSRGARRSLGFNRKRARSSGSRSRPRCTTDETALQNAAQVRPPSSKPGSPGRCPGPLASRRCPRRTALTSTTPSCALTTSTSASPTGSVPVTRYSISAAEPG